MTTQITSIVEKVQLDLSKLSSHLEGYKVVDTETQESCIEFLSQLKARKKKIDELRKEFVGPLNAQVKKINGMFKVETVKIDEMDKALRRTLKEYMDEEARKTKELAKKQMEEAKSVEEVDAVVEVKPTVRAESGSATRKLVWKWEVEDVKALMESRPDLFIVDKKLLDELMRQGVRQLPGVRFYQDSQISIR